MFFRFLLYREVQKFWSSSYRNFCWEFICKAPLTLELYKRGELKYWWICMSRCLFVCFYIPACNDKKYPLDISCWTNVMACQRKNGHGAYEFYRNPENRKIPNTPHWTSTLDSFGKLKNWRIGMIQRLFECFFLPASKNEKIPLICHNVTAFRPVRVKMAMGYLDSSKIHIVYIEPRILIALVN